LNWTAQLVKGGASVRGPPCDQRARGQPCTRPSQQRQHIMVDALVISHAVTAAAAAPFHPDRGSSSPPWWMHSLAHTSVGSQREQARDMMWGVNCVNCSCGSCSRSDSQVVALGWMKAWLEHDVGRELLPQFVAQTMKSRALGVGVSMLPCTAATWHALRQADQHCEV